MPFMQLQLKIVEHLALKMIPISNGRILGRPVCRAQLRQRLHDSLICWLIEEWDGDTGFGRIAVDDTVYGRLKKTV